MADQSGLREFVAVVEHGSFTAAADALNVSTAFVSREVKRLEERLNARLLHRTTRKYRSRAIQERRPEKWPLALSGFIPSRSHKRAQCQPLTGSLQSAWFPISIPLDKVRQA
jgi:IS30 family transposase